MRQTPIVRTNFKLFVGIDPGTDTGVAIWNREKKRFDQIQTLAIHRAMELVNGLNKLYPGQIYVRFEDARKRKFFRGENMAAKQQGAGSIKRDSTIWEDFLKDHRIVFEGTTAGKLKTKYSAEEFEKLTGWTQRTSNHARDAAILVYGY
jgi:hypothetical protein